MLIDSIINYFIKENYVVIPDLIELFKKVINKFYLIILKSSYFIKFDCLNLKFLELLITLCDECLH